MIKQIIWNVNIGESMWKIHRNSPQVSFKSEILLKIKSLKRKEKDMALEPECSCLTHGYEIVFLSSIMEWVVSPNNSYADIPIPECDCIWTQDLWRGFEVTMGSFVWALIQ